MKSVVPKNHKPIEHWQNPHFAPGDIKVPELKVTSMFVVPMLIQVEQHIEALVETVTRMLANVGIISELFLSPDLVKSAHGRSKGSTGRHNLASTRFAPTLGAGKDALPERSPDYRLICDITMNLNAYWHPPPIAEPPQDADGDNWALVGSRPRRG